MVIYVFERILDDKSNDPHSDYNSICFITHKKINHGLITDFLYRWGYECVFKDSKTLKCDKCKKDVYEALESYIENSYYTKKLQINRNVFYLLKDLRYLNICSDMSIIFNILCKHKEKLGRCNII